MPDWLLSIIMGYFFCYFLGNNRYDTPARLLDQPHPLRKSINSGRKRTHWTGVELERRGLGGDEFVKITRGEKRGIHSHPEWSRGEKRVFCGVKQRDSLGCRNRCSPVLKS